MHITKRQMAIRGAVALLWIVLGVVIFIFNSGHQLLVDNHSVETLSLDAPDSLKMSINGGKKVEFFRNDRDIFKVGGGKHKITIEFSDGTPVFTTTFSLPLKGDMFLLSIPKMVNGIEPYFEIYVNNEIQSRKDEEPLPGSELEAPLAF